MGHDLPEASDSKVFNAFCSVYKGANQAKSAVQPANSQWHLVQSMNNLALSRLSAFVLDIAVA